MILAIDQGTTGSTCLVFDREGKIAGRAYSEFEQHFPRPGWVEHDANEIWDVTLRVAGEALADAGTEGSALDGIGITNQRETVVAWDPSTGEPVHNALVWQDRRTAARCDELREAGKEDLIRERTGLVLDPYFSGTKIEWLLSNVDAAKDAVFGTIDSWLVFKLTGRHATEVSNASRTLLFDIGKGIWDAELCDLLGVDPGRLGEPLASAGEFGTTSELGGEIPVCGVAGDQQAALFGQACHEPGDAKNTYGTGSFVLLNSGTDMPDPREGLLTTIAWNLGERDRPTRSRRRSSSRARRSNGFATGSASSPRRPRPRSSHARSIRTTASTSSRRSPGSGSPHWDPYARGTIVGLTRGAGRAHLARAALEGIAYETVDAVRAQEAASGEALSELRADGGAAENSWLMQFQADILGVPVVVPEIAETTALGAAYLAGIGAGVWDLDEVAERWREAERFEPSMSDDERETLLDGWHRALERSRDWASSEAE